MISICVIGYGMNLVKNGDAEIGSCNRSTGGVSPAYWRSTGLLTQLNYSDPDGAVDPTTPGPRYSLFIQIVSKRYTYGILFLVIVVIVIFGVVLVHMYICIK